MENTLKLKSINEKRTKSENLRLLLNRVVKLFSKAIHRENVSGNNGIINDIENLVDQIKWQNQKFNMEQNVDLIDSNIYHLRAMENKLNYLIRKAKEEKLTCEPEKREMIKRYEKMHLEL